MDGPSRITHHASRYTWATLLLVPLLLVLGSSLVSAQSPHHAALIVDFGDGRVLVRVVSFAEETISGVDLLQRSGLNVAIMSNLGGGAALCAVEEVGCPPTPQDCFCQCRGGGCLYWSYFHLQGGAWTYAGMGAASYALHDGDVDGWAWGDGRAAPPVLTWDEIWARSGVQPTAPPAPAPSATPIVPTATVPRPTTAPVATVPTEVSPVTALPPSTGTPAPSALPTTGLPTPLPPTPEPTAAVAPSPALAPSPTVPIAPAGGGGSSLGTALAFGGFVLVLLALGFWVRRAKKHE